MKIDNECRTATAEIGASHSEIGMNQAVSDERWWIMLTIHIREFERGLRFRRGDFDRVLRPGSYWIVPDHLRFDGVRFERVNTLDTVFEHPLLDVLLGHEDLRSELEIVDLKDHERAIVWKDDRVAYVLRPGRHALWRKPYNLRIQVCDVSDPRIAPAEAKALRQVRGASLHTEEVHVAPHERARLTIDGRDEGFLDPGRHLFWRTERQITVDRIDMREQMIDIAGQEIMTRDKVTLRVNLLVTYRVTDPLKALTVATDTNQSLYRQAQLVLRAAIGGRELDTLLTDKEQIGDEITRTLQTQASKLGVQIGHVGLRDIILPGDMKVILNQVIEAQKSAEANLIRRREETAAARSQANTAKLLAENPLLARLKEMEALQEVLSGAEVTFVFGQGPLFEQIRGLIASET
jgi:regulator of protease activity HflC (stomatin/prohibitin superfamily)